MTSLIGRVALALALLIPIAGSATKPVPKPAAAHNWLATANRTPEGAIVIGNPAARVKLVEYLSMTCPHCAVLSGESLKPLQQNYIARGIVSLEVRHAVRDPYDLIASMLVRCQPTRDYLSAIETVFTTQEDWMAKGSAASSDASFASKTPDEQLKLVAKAAGFDSLFAKRGMTPKRYAACLADAAGKQQLVTMAGNSWDRDAIPGTPAIKINGEMQPNVTSWADLDARIKAAIH